MDEARKEKEAEEYFFRLSEQFKFIKADISVDKDPIKCLDDIHLAEEKISACDKFLETLKQYVNYDHFKNVLDKHFVYSSGFSKFGTIEEFSVSAWTDREGYVKNVVAILSKESLQYKEDLKKAIFRIRSNADFQKELLSLPSYTINIDPHAHKLQTQQTLDEIKFSNVTSKTVYERLGTFVVIDVETTGLKSMTDEIIEIGAIYFENWEPCLKFETLIKPSKKISSQITHLTGITNEMVSNSPAFYQIVQSLNEFVGKKNIVGHNLFFDLCFLYNSGYDFSSQKRKYYDTLELSKKVLTSPSRGRTIYDGDFDVENHKLSTLCDYYGIRDNSTGHRAISDCLATGYLFKKLSLSRTS